MIDVQGGATGPGALRRKCYNEETFADFLPVEKVPVKDLFISASGHAMTCEELVTWLLIKRAWINPLHPAPFTPEDVAAIRAWKHPQIARLAELDRAAAACLASARNARRAGDEELARDYRRQAATLAPYHLRLDAFDLWVPLIKMPRRRASLHAPAAPLAVPARSGWRLPSFGALARVTPAVRRGGLAPPARVQVAQRLDHQPVMAPVPQATWDALRRLSDMLMQDASGDMLASWTALIAWKEHADALAPEVLASIDAQVSIFGHPFSIQYRSAVDPTYRVGDRQCGATDLGRQLYGALQAIPQSA